MPHHIIKALLLFYWTAVIAHNFLYGRKDLIWENPLQINHAMSCCFDVYKRPYFKSKTFSDQQAIFLYEFSPLQTRIAFVLTPPVPTPTTRLIHLTYNIIGFLQFSNFTISPLSKFCNLPLFENEYLHLRYQLVTLVGSSQTVTNFFWCIMNIKSNFK